MSTLYIDCRMGVNGVKIMGALAELLENPESFVRRFNEIGLSGIRLERRSDAVGGIKGSYMEFKRSGASVNPYEDEMDDEGGKIHRQHHSHYRSLEQIKDIIDELPLSGKLRKQAIGIYETIAQATADANGRDKDTQKLHRGSSKQTIASVIGTCMLFDELDCEHIIVSPPAVGSGYAETSRGKMPIPIPALQNILEGIPYSSGSEEGEVCTLEGAAILKTFADSFEDMPELTVLRSGAGFGEEKYRHGVNCVRAYLGKVVKTSANSAVTELEATLYNDSTQSLKLAAERLRDAGAVEAYTVPVSMLGGGAGLILKCICSNDDAYEVASEILRSTSASLVRRTAEAAYKTEQTIIETDTSIGKINMIKTSGFGVSEVRPEPASVMKAARENGISYIDAYNKVIKESSI